MTFSSQLIEVLNYLGEKFGIAIDWTQDNVMPYLQTLATKYISWEIATSWVWIGVGGLLILIAIGLFILDGVACCDGIPSVFGVIISIIAIMVIIVQVLDIVECKYFPEKSILEYIQYMQRVKGV